MNAIRRTVPSLFTGASLCLGLVSLLASHLLYLELAAWAIVWCALLDIADGVAARILKAESRFGAEFDSLADLVAFGIAPAGLAWAAREQTLGVPMSMSADAAYLAACAFFVLTSAVRLARFNADTSRPATTWFEGLPTTLTGGIVATAILTASRQGLAFGGAFVAVTAGLLVVLGVAMVSRLRFPKIRARSSRVMNALQLAIIATVYACGILRLAPEYLLAVAAGFALTGIAAGLIAKDPSRT